MTLLEGFGKDGLFCVVKSSAICGEDNSLEQSYMFCVSWNSSISLNENFVGLLFININ